MAFLWRLWRAAAVTGPASPPRPVPPPAGCRRAVPPAGTGEARAAITGRPGDGEGEGWGGVVATPLHRRGRKEGLIVVANEEGAHKGCKVNDTDKMYAIVHGLFTHIGCAQCNARDNNWELSSVYR